MTFHSIPFTPRRIEATEQRLEAIYEAAKLGLKGDALALAAGLMPVEYARLCEVDPVAEMAARKGKADGEMLHARKLAQASEAGDAKASLAILQHVHGWSARQEISLTVDNISISEVLEAAKARASNVLDIDVTEVLPKDSNGPATNLLASGREQANAGDLVSRNR
jgi:hypothetical protein